MITSWQLLQLPTSVFFIANNIFSVPIFVKSLFRSQRQSNYSLKRLDDKFHTKNIFISEASLSIAYTENCLFIYTNKNNDILGYIAYIVDKQYNYNCQRCDAILRTL